MIHIMSTVFIMRNLISAILKIKPSNLDVLNNYET